jgi:hypothetical protein
MRCIGTLAILEFSTPRRSAKSRNPVPLGHMAELVSNPGPVTDRSCTAEPYITGTGETPLK